MQNYGNELLALPVPVALIVMESQAEIDVETRLHMHTQEQLGKNDQAMEPGTNIHVNSIGAGVYKGWQKATVGKNIHLIEFGGRTQKIQLAKKDTNWHVVVKIVDHDLTQDLDSAVKD